MIVKPKKILLIEDDLIMRENTTEILELAEFEVVTAPNGKKGSVLAKEIIPDLIICDIMMPELDGYGVFHILSKDIKTAGIPFIFLSAKAEKNEIRKGMELGADDYLTKPFEDTELLSAIESRLKKHETLKKFHTNDLPTLNQFFDNARGIVELEELSHQRPAIGYKKKQVVYHAGDNPQYLYFLSKGKVKVYKTHDDGKEFVTQVFVTGDFFGLSPLFENKNYSESALVLEESEICKIPKNDFLTLIYKNKDVAQQFIKMLSNHVDEREKQLLSMAYDTVRKRVAEALVQLESRFRLEENQRTRVLITREDLANMVGTATETVIRCLSDFKTDSLIENCGREIVILDREGLAQIQY
jgi:CRP-like cAMP-binding protein/CheY-like chemotaxis protein